MPNFLTVLLCVQYRVGFGCVAAGVVGPWLIGRVKTAFGGFAAPVAMLSGLSALGVCYFAVLMRFLPVKKRDANGEVEALL